MAALTAGLLAASVASSFFGQRDQANAAIAGGNYAAGIDRMNAQIADQQAADAISRGQEQEAMRYGTGRQEQGAIAAASGASGTLATGSTSAVQAQSIRDTGLDMATIRNNAARQAWGYKVDATNYLGQANLAQMSGQNQAAGYRAGAWGTLLTGAAKGYQMYDTYTQNRQPRS